ncbi:agmatine deiminase family protein [Phyllobacterium sp. YR531]|uniref:agmatine deiminase family protein n=1 Tax=Phyllobacterium sp. YR531 TaxID=1144343 RepID=UPI00026FA1E3|nr:agmatine deiminase family protein [Phyllobacterium sp. YR531]EJM99308.1 peptidylarginine deiminase-like enzyme [Phyllobacterium sp. YR531]
MTTRRNILKLASGAVLAGTVGKGTSMAAASENVWTMPDEGDPHTATWMAFGPSQEVWGKKLQRGAQNNLAQIAKAIAAHEPVNMLVREEDHEIAESLCGGDVTLFVRDIDDLWMRDTGPVFVKSQAGKLAAVDFNFNGWGNKQAHDADAEVAEFVAEKSTIEVLRTKLVLEGGGIEVDGKGTAIITESCVLNKNRNPGVSKEQCEAELGRLLGLKKIIWLPGIAGKDITDGHTDFYARFIRPGVVVAGLDNDPSSYDHAVTKRHLEILKTATDGAGNKLEVIVIPGPESIRPQFENNEFAAGYINFYLCNGAVIVPEFGDKKADQYCRDALRDALPDREVVQLDIDAIAAGGGGIHCTTQQQPA